MEEKKYPIGGFAPGHYSCKCGTCGETFRGDKRAVQCEPCALEAKARFDALSPEEQAEVIKRNAEAVNEVFKDWGKKPDVNLAIMGHGKPELNHDRVIANQVAGMPLEEAIFQDGYSAGHDAGYEKGRREAKPGARWVKGTRGFPIKKPVIAKKFISHLNREVVGTASSATGEMICFDWGVSSICLAIGHEELNDLAWLHESAAGREDAVEFAEWAATIAFYDDGTRLWELIGEGEAINGQFRFTTKEFYDLFKQQKEK